MADKIYDILVIGAGPGGYHCAIRGAQCGLSVAIVEKDDGSGIGGLGGVCLNWGCIPSKSLLKNAELLYHMLDAKTWGFSFENFKADMSVAVGRSRRVANRLTKGVEFLLKKNGIDLIRGKAVLKSSSQVEVEENVYVAKNIVLATGASPRELPNLPFDDETVISSRQALELREPPSSIAIIGASAIGVEFAYYFNAYGIKVQILELENRIVPKEDEEISAELTRHYRKLGIKMHTGVLVKNVEKRDDGMITITYKNGDQTEGEVEVEKVLVGVGVVPNVHGIGLESIGVAIEKGAIKIDAKMSTSVNGVYAVGDVTGKLPLAHAAFDQGSAVAELIAGKTPPRLDYKFMPKCTYCQPEIASMGYTENEIKAQGIKYMVAKAPVASAGKSIAINEPAGFVKVIFSEESGELLGAHLIGANVTEMLVQFGLLRNLEGTHEEVQLTTYAHPTLSEALKEACAAITNSQIHF